MQIIMDFLGDIEKEDECSGICDKKDLYYFSNLNKGIPKKECKDAIKKKIFWTTFGQFGIGTTITGFFFCIPCILNLILCFLPGKGNCVKKVPGNII